MAIPESQSRLCEELIYIDSTGMETSLEFVKNQPTTEDLTKSEYDRQYQGLTAQAERGLLSFQKLRRLQYIREKRLGKKRVDGSLRSSNGRNRATYKLPLTFPSHRVDRGTRHRTL